MKHRIGANAACTVMRTWMFGFLFCPALIWSFIQFNRIVCRFTLLSGTNEIVGVRNIQCAYNTYGSMVLSKWMSSHTTTDKLVLFHVFSAVTRDSARQKVSGWSEWKKTCTAKCSQWNFGKARLNETGYQTHVGKVRPCWNKRSPDTN